MLQGDEPERSSGDGIEDDDKCGAGGGDKQQRHGGLRGGVAISSGGGGRAAAGSGRSGRAGQGDQGNGGGSGKQEQVAETGVARNKKKAARPLSSMQRLAAKVQAQKDCERVERERQRCEAEQGRRAAEQAQRRRGKEKKAFLKRTRSGQPVMKGRIEKLLEKLEAGA